MSINEIHFSSVDSTNNYLKENYESLDNLTFASTDYQSGGKGRNGRKWFSPSGENLLFSVLNKDLSYIDDPSLFSVFASVCVAKTLEELGLQNISIKWPNDIYVDGKKICGILSEGKYIDNKFAYVIIGIGLNVNQTFMGEEILHPFTSIKLELEENVDITKVKEILFPKIQEMILSINDDKGEYFTYINEHNYLQNKEVYASINGEKSLVKVISIKDGMLEVKKGEEILLLNSGEVTFHL